MRRRKNVGGWVRNGVIHSERKVIDRIKYSVIVHEYYDVDDNIDIV